MVPPNHDGRLIEALRASRVFGVLDEAILSDLAAHLELQTVLGGNQILREGDSSDAMLIVVSGRLRVSRRGKDGDLLLYNEVCPGECVGEVGMILDMPRTADVTAVRDSTLALLHRASFEALIKLHPLELTRVFSQAIFNHLRHAQQLNDGPVAQTIVVIPLHAGAKADEVAIGLTQAFARQGRSYHVPPTAQLDASPSGMQDLNGRLDELERQFEFLVFEAEANTSALTRHIFRQADQVIFVADADASPEAGEIEQFLKGEPGFSMKRKHLVLLHPATANKPNDPGQWRLDRDLERIYLLRRGRADDYAHLARFFSGCAVGVVLGGGGARGFGHIGVLRALEECGIPVDLIGGNSMGALIGAQYACGMTHDDIREQTMRFALGGEHPTLPLVSLFGGRRIERDLQRMFGDRTIDTLWRPYFAAACNLSQACTTVQDSGPLWRAVLASNSPAGLLPPVLHKGQLLVDGAILDNVPVDAMRRRLGTPHERRRGNGTIIAIDVDVREEFGVDAKLTRLSPWSTIKGYFSSDADPLPGIGDILYRASHIGGLNQRTRTVALADHYLEPPVAAFPLMGYRRATEIVDVGYRYAMEKIELWDRESLPRESSR